jgi:hypothetical protein
MGLRLGARPAALVAASTSFLLLATHAAAQGVQPPGPDQSVVVSSWRIAAGHHRFALRDVARTGRPVDASPVAWRGTGPAFLVQHTRARTSSLHRFEISGAFAGGFAYDSGLETIARPEGDRARRIEGRYEYRRYPLADLFMNGLDAGIGVQGIGARSSIVRHVPVDLQSSETTTSGAVAVVAAARLRRWSRLDLEVTWTNGLGVATISERHSAGAAAERTRSGGGWLTDLAIAAGVPMTGRTSLAVVYLRTNDGLLSSHRSWTTARSAITFGVTYAK